MDKLKSVKPWIIRKEEKPVSQGEYLQTPAELEAFHQFTQCINCMLCYAACPVYGLEPKFLGPAAIALGYRYNMDSRDQGKDQRAMIGNHDGIWDCTFVGECSVVCPKACRSGRGHTALESGHHQKLVSVDPDALGATMTHSTKLRVILRRIEG